MKYTVNLARYRLEFAPVEVEADTPEHAADLALAIEEEDGTHPATAPEWELIDWLGEVHVAEILDEQGTVLKATQGDHDAIGEPIPDPR